MVNTNNNTETAADSKCTEQSWRHIQQINKTKSFIINTNNRVLLFLLLLFFFFITETQISFIYIRHLFSRNCGLRTSEVIQNQLYCLQFSSFHWCKCPCQWNSLSRKSKIFSEVEFLFHSFALFCILLLLRPWLPRFCLQSSKCHCVVVYGANQQLAFKCLFGLKSCVDWHILCIIFFDSFLYVYNTCKLNQHAFEQLCSFAQQVKHSQRANKHLLNVAF